MCVRWPVPTPPSHSHCNKPFASKNMSKFLQSIIPSSILKKIKADWNFRPEDPNRLMQILPQMDVNTPVERIKGFRYPAPGSRLDARVPIRESDNDIYDTNFFPRNGANIDTHNETRFNSTTPKMIQFDSPKLASHGKRKLSPLPYDETGLRTTKTVSWDAVGKSLAARAVPNHLPAPEWVSSYAALAEDRLAKGLPLPTGQRQKLISTANYNQIRW